MSVEASESLTEVWTRWQGQVINTTFPLGRCVGSSDHSGVFLTRSTARGPADVAIKLVPTNRALAELLLPRWKRAAGLAHPHLLPLLQWGGCQLEGLPYLYALIEYADQTLAQLLTRRAMTDDEARELLPPALEALAFLHDQDLVQGQLKPGNILVVGDQVKLASDTVRRFREGAISTHAPTPYDPPEARQGSTSPAGDIWALGVTLFEALTRRLPSGLGAPGEAPMLPADFSPVFRDIVARCLSPDPQDRPSVAELAAFARGESAEPAPATTIDIPVLALPEPTPTEPNVSATTMVEPTMVEPTMAEPTMAEPTMAEPTMAEPMAAEWTMPEPMAAAPMTREAMTPEAMTPEATVPEPLPPVPEPLATLPAHLVPAGEQPEQPAEDPPEHRSSLGMILGALVILAVLWGAARVFSGHGVPAPPQPPPPAQASVAPPAADAVGLLPAHTAPQPPRSVAAPSGLHQVMPDVSLRARRTIHGHIKVWVRVIVSEDGSVFAASPDRAGSSRYFERLALDAAKQWTFPVLDAPARRIMQVRFDFSRDGVTGRAVTLR
jgi:outer membrane biosynthesis protein TonB